MNYFDNVHKDILEYYKILEPEFPIWLNEYINTKELLAQKYISVTCGTIYSDLFPKLEKIGKIPQDFDLQIASIAIANNMILVTRNIRDFEAICSVSNLMIENWFEEKE